MSFEEESLHLHYIFLLLPFSPFSLPSFIVGHGMH